MWEQTRKTLGYLQIAPIELVMTKQRAGLLEIFQEFGSLEWAWLVLMGDRSNV